MTQAKSFFLVLGVGRGGTTLLANCLDSHPAICCLNETADDALRGKRGWRVAALRRMAGLPVASRLAAFLERRTDQAQARRAAQAEAAERTGWQRARAFYDEIQPMLTQRAERVAGDKITTESLAMIYRPPFSAEDMPTVDPFERVRRKRLEHFCTELFVAYHFIFIARDGRRVVESKMRREKLPLVEAAVRWLECARIHGALASVLSERLLTLAFEELVAQPEPTLRRACEFLGVDFDQRMLAGAQRSYAGESHAGFDRRSMTAPVNNQLDSLLHEGLIHFNYIEE